MPYFDTLGVILVGMDGEVGEGLSEVMAVMGPLYRRAARSLEAASVGVSVGTRAVLELLATTDAQPVPRIAEDLELSRQFVQRCVDQGLASGLLARLPNPAHQRSNLILVTPAGLELLTGIMSRERQLLGEVGHGLTSEQVATCVHVLRVLRAQVPWD